MFVTMQLSLCTCMSFQSPSSLHFVDLRLCYPTGHITRTCYEYDTSFFNGYYQSEHKGSFSPPPPVPAAAAIKREAHSRGSDQAEVLYNNYMILAIWQSAFFRILGWGVLLCVPKNLYCKDSLLHVELNQD